MFYKKGSFYLNSVKSMSYSKCLLDQSLAKILSPDISGIHIKTKNQKHDSMFSEKYHLLRDLSDTSSNQSLEGAAADTTHIGLTTLREPLMTGKSWRSC